MVETVREFKLFKEENATDGTTTGRFKITIPYPDTIPDDKAKDLCIFWMNPAINRWEKIGGTVDTITHTVTVEVDHLSIFRLVRVLNLPTNVIVYPNPYIADKHDKICFKGITKDSLIKIFTLAGELVKEIRVSKTPEEWEIKEEAIASGIYLYLIIDPQGSKTTGKIGVIK